MSIAAPVLALFLAPQAAAPQTAPTGGIAPIDVKIAFVDTGAVLQRSEAGKKQIEAIERVAADRGADLEAKGAELQELRAVFSQQAASMNATARAEAQQQIADRERELSRAQEDFNAEINVLQNSMLQRMADNIKAVVEEYAKENGIAVVFIRSPGMPFVDAAIDLTDQVVERYNVKYPVPAGQ